MNYRYSDYSVEQLRQEVGKLKEKLQKAEQLGNVSEAAIYERKMQVALAYTLNPDDFKAGQIYSLRNDIGHRFKVERLKGVFAWGNRVNLLGEVYEETEAIPISLLENENA
ncbi:YfhH family protein [Virgibacillus sp. 179-BFC.A HS]|uniref:YfhH family protein n=1 Tax=Tigheibacillus jepli TaxID=3035914 RepID=A0ABU5CKI8_9BACI|nr:YfhH family protein [Virgibacillus sp. 179-BFC.A HS]MDY0406877.1 YfhH family protein [Virgibacillus sp. 179-BFC.A HS]